LTYTFADVADATGRLSSPRTSTATVRHGRPPTAGPPDPGDPVLLRQVMVIGASDWLVILEQDRAEAVDRPLEDRLRILEAAVDDGLEIPTCPYQRPAVGSSMEGTAFSVRYWRASESAQCHVGIKFLQ